MLGIAYLVLMFWDLYESELVVSLPASLLLLLTQWLSVVIPFFGLLYDVVVGVILVKLMASSQDVAAWFGAVMNSSFDNES